MDSVYIVSQSADLNHFQGRSAPDRMASAPVTSLCFAPVHVALEL